MLKNMSNLGKSLSKSEQQEVNGGKKGQPVCNSPYFKSDPNEVCIAGYHDHPTNPHCICCRD